MKDDLRAYADAELRDVRKWAEELSISAVELREMQALEDEAAHLWEEVEALFDDASASRSDHGEGTVMPD